jgi:hypothetical protein
MGQKRSRPAEEKGPFLFSSFNPHPIFSSFVCRKAHKKRPCSACAGVQAFMAGFFPFFPTAFKVGV